MCRFVHSSVSRFDVDAGIDSPGWKQLLKLAADGAWVKLDGVYRLSKTPQYSDTIPFGQSLLDVAPDRCVWGSDWPHVGFWRPMPNVGDLLDALADWAPERALRNAVLVDNPHALYGFESWTLS